MAFLIIWILSKELHLFISLLKRFYLHAFQNPFEVQSEGIFQLDPESEDKVLSYVPDKKNVSFSADAKVLSIVKNFLLDCVEVEMERWLNLIRKEVWFDTITIHKSLYDNLLSHVEHEWLYPIC